MNLFGISWRGIIIFLFSASIRRPGCPLLLGECNRIVPVGHLTVEPGPLFPLCSDLTVYCHVTQLKCEGRFNMSLHLNGKPVKQWKRINCSTMKFIVSDVCTPQSEVLCMLMKEGLPIIVDGRDLQGGLRPDPPTNIHCETSRNSDLIDCSWSKGRETHVPTTYSISFSRENGTQIHVEKIQNAEEVPVARTMLGEDSKYQMIITAYNHFGVSKSKPFIFCVKDVVIPDTPRITRIEFWNSSLAAMLYWKSSESSAHLQTYLRLSTDDHSWELREGTELTEGLIRVDGLKPLTEYAFQMRTCNTTSGLTHTNNPNSTTSLTPSRRALCSKWSPSARKRSPGKGPSQQLPVWRVLGRRETNGLQAVTVLWKPLSPEDYSGEVQHYKIILDNDQKQVMACAGGVNQCLVQVPPGVQTLSVSVVTSHGKSPLADVPLRHSGVVGVALRELAPADNGSAVFVSWSQPGTEHWPTSGGEQPTHYIVEWRNGSAALHWQRVDRDQKSTFIRGLTAGVRYNISLYAVTSSCVSAPSSGLVYSKQQKPACGPNMSVLVHEHRRIQIQWDELAVYQQRGFITKYNIYLQTLDSNHTEHRVTVSSSEPRLMWLDCPEGALVLYMTASTSAGEGLRGKMISSDQPADPAVGLVIVLVFIATVFVAISANLMCWSCVRKRIKEKCISLGPAWLVENLPKVGNSNAIKLLEQQDRNIFQPFFDVTQSEPPLSPVEEISQEEEIYPVVHVEAVSVDPEGRTNDETLQASHTGTVLLDSLMEHVSYKPQIAPKRNEGEEVKERDEEQRDVPAGEEDSRCSSVSGGLLGGLLWNLEMEHCHSFSELALGSVSGLLLPTTTPETLNVFNRDAERRSQSEMEAGPLSLDLQQAEIMSPHIADVCLTTGYFPQVATVKSTTTLNTEEEKMLGKTQTS